MSAAPSRACAAAVLVAGFLVSSHRTALAFSAAAPARILYVGDSIAAETRDTVKWWTQTTGKAVLSDSLFPGLALCDFLEGKPSALPIDKRLQAQVQSLKPDLIVLQFWGNPWTDCIKQTASGEDHFTEAYFNQYFFDALNAVQQVSAAAQQAGIAKPRMLWVLQGPDRDFPDRTRRLNEGYAYAAGTSSDRTSDAGFDVSMAAYPYPGGSHDRYEWTRFLPCSDFERQLGYCTNPESFGGVTMLHKETDPVHFCIGTSSNFGLSCDTPSPGILRYGMRIAHDANTWLGI